jgi:hypothetical protein
MRIGYRIRTRKFESATITYYSLLLGPMAGLTVNLTEPVVETSTFSAMVCRLVFLGVNERVTSAWNVFD